MSCEDCEEVYKGNPPCEDCPKPEDLCSENKECWNVWSILSNQDRPVSMSGPMKIPTQAMLNLCDFYGMTEDDFNRIMRIEFLMFPKLLDKSKDTDTEEV